MKTCPKCSGILDFRMHFQRHMCTSCGWMESFTPKRVLTMKWDSDERQLTVIHPIGIIAKNDSKYLFNHVFTKAFEEEMTKRGYNIKTMKFEIEVDEAWFRENYPSENDLKEKENERGIL